MGFWQLFRSNPRIDTIDEIYEKLKDVTN